jgi:hypothetical protein
VLGIGNQIFDIGRAPIEKKCVSGLEALTSCERPIQCVWIIDMCNTGDLDTARDVDLQYLDDGAKAAALLEISIAQEMFGMRESELKRRFFDLFEPSAPCCGR